MNTTYFKNLVMGNVFGTKQDPPLPSAYYLGLSSSEPNAEGTGATEPSLEGSAYARVQLNNLSQPDNGQISNQDTVSFPESTSDWGVMTHYVIYDNAIGGNLLSFGPLENSRHVEINSVVAFKAGGIKITMSDIE